MGFHSITKSTPSLIQSKNNPEKQQYRLSVYLLQFFAEKKKKDRYLTKIWLHDEYNAFNDLKY